MANAKRCDRCGKIYDHIDDEKKAFFIFKYNSSDIRGWPDERLDLCNDCYKDLEKFINIKDHEEVVADNISQECRHCKFSSFSVYHEPCSTCKMLHTHFVPQETNNEKLKIQHIDPSTVKCSECKHKVDNVCTVIWNGKEDCVNYDKFEPRK